MKIQTRKGRLVLAATAAAALAACGDDGATADGGDAGTGSTGGSTTSDQPTTTTLATGSTSTTGGVEESSSTGAGAADSSGSSSTSVGDETGSSSSGGTGSTDTGSDTSTGDDTGTGGGQVSLTPDDACPFPASFYDSGEFTPEPRPPGLSTFAGPQAFVGEVSGDLHLFEGTPGNDRINTSEGFDENNFPCIVAGDGDDLIEFEYGSAGEDVSFAVVSGGIGADTFAFRMGNTLPEGPAAVPTIIDYEVGVDRLVYDVSSINGAEAAEASVFFIDEYDEGAPAPPGPGIVVDNLDEEVWYFNGETSSLIAHVEADGELDADDVELIETLPGCSTHLTMNMNFNDFRGFQSGESGDAFTGEFNTFATENQIVIGSPEDDRFVVEGDSGTLCASGSDGADTMVSRHNDFGESSNNVLVGGQGPDNFAINDDFVSSNPGAVTEQTVIGDFEPGVDTLTLNRAGFDLTGEVAEASILFIDNWDQDTADLTATRQIVVDAAQGFVYVSDNVTGTHQAVVLHDQPAIMPSDIVLLDGPIP